VKLAIFALVYFTTQHLILVFGSWIRWVTKRVRVSNWAMLKSSGEVAEADDDC